MIRRLLASTAAFSGDVGVGVDERFDQAHALVREHVVVELAVDQQQLATQAAGVRGVHQRPPVLIGDIPVVLLDPERQVDREVVRPRLGDAHREEPGAGQQGPGGEEPAAGVPGDPHPSRVEPAVPAPELTDGGDMVVQCRSHAEVTVGVVEERLAAQRGAAAVQGDDREAERRQRLGFPGEQVTERR